MSDVTVSVDMSELVALARRCPQVADVVQQEATVAVQRVVLMGEAGAKRRISVDTGHERRSITSLVKPAGTGIVGVFGTNVPYGPTREFGRRAGAKMPPKGSLVGWMRRHGMNPANEYLLRRAIARHGTKGDHAFRDTLNDLKPRIEREFGRIKPRVIRTLRGGA